MAAPQQPAPKQPPQAPTPSQQHAVGIKRSAEAALSAPAPALPQACPGLALGIPILPHPAALAARDAAAAAVGAPAGRALPGLVVGQALEASADPPAAPDPPPRPASAPAPAPAAGAPSPLPLFQPSPALAAVVAAAAAAAAAEGHAGSGDDDEQPQHAAEAGHGGAGGGGAWAGEHGASAAEEQPPNKKSRLVWTQELHNRFINALSHLVGAPRAGGCLGQVAGRTGYVQRALPTRGAGAAPPAGTDSAL